MKEIEKFLINKSKAKWDIYYCSYWDRCKFLDMQIVNAQQK